MEVRRASPALSATRGKNRQQTFVSLGSSVCHDAATTQSVQMCCIVWRPAYETMIVVMSSAAPSDIAHIARIYARD